MTLALAALAALALFGGLAGTQRSAPVLPPKPKPKPKPRKTQIKAPSQRPAPKPPEVVITAPSVPATLEPAATPALSPAEQAALDAANAARIVQESKEIIHGQRDAYSEPKPKPRPKAPKSTPKPAPANPPRTHIKSPPAQATKTEDPRLPPPGEPTPEPQPIGYNPEAARRGAKQVAANLAKGRAGYSRALLTTWQRNAGLKPDGIYGGATRGALIHFGVKDPPKPFFPPLETIRYTPPGGSASTPSSSSSSSAPSSPSSPSSSSAHSTAPDGYDPEAARRAAPAVAAHLARTGRSGYDRRLLEQWQRQAGLTPDRAYGGGTRGALIYYGVPNPPEPFFAPFTTTPFAPPG